MKKPTSEAQKRAVAKYEKANIRRIVIKLNRNTDQDIIEHLNNIENVQGYIKELIRRDK